MSHITISKIKQRERPFLMMDKNPLFDPSYSWAEKGMLATLLAAKSDGSVKLTEMHHFSSDGEAATKTAQKGLKRLGHLKVVNEAGRWFAEVFEEPLQEPVLTFEKRKKPANKLADVLKANGLSEEQIANIIAQVDTDEVQETAPTKVTPTTPSVVAAVPVVANAPDRNLVSIYTERLKTDAQFISKTILDYKVTDVQLDELFTEFIDKPASLGVPNTESYEKFCSHFYYWIPKATKARQQRANMKQGKDKPKLPTHDEILTELQRGIKMIYASSEYGYKYMCEAIENTVHWIEKAVKLKLPVDADTQKKAEYILSIKDNEVKKNTLFDYIKAKSEEKQDRQEA